MPLKLYDSWEEAARASKRDMAVATWPVNIQDRDGNMVKAEIIKPLSGDPWFSYYHTYRRIRQAKARECDMIRQWKAF
jgi:hypothetical protein